MINREDIKVYGYWREKLGDDLFKCGIEFTIDENERTNLTRILNQVQVKMRNNILFAEGDFIPRHLMLILIPTIINNWKFYMS